MRYDSGGRNALAGVSAVISELESRKAAIEKALEALRDADGTPTRGSSATAKKRGRPAKRKGRITEAGRGRLRQAMKRRWAVKRAAATAKKATKKARKKTA